MRCIKILYVYDLDYDASDYWITKKVIADTTGWADVTEDTFRLLQRYLARVLKNTQGINAIIVEDPGDNILPKTIQAAEELAKAEERRVEAEAKARKLRKQQKNKTKLEQKKAELAKLQKEIEQAEG